MAPCLGCGRIFMFDPDQVPSIRVSRVDGKWVNDQEHGHREPVCPACCQAANPERARLGYPLLPEHDTAEALAREGGT
jgi:hypothetical protein